MSTLLAYSRTKKALSMAETSQQVESYQLFKTDWCGFCFRVRRFIDKHDIELPLRDINQDQDAFRELLSATNRTTVPCLRIQKGEDVEWMFESMDIIEFLAQRHGVA
ncbi:MAG: glutaredoxin [Pseudomonadota bacterium]